MNVRIVIKTCFVLLLLGVQLLPARAQEVPTLLDRYMADVRSGSHPAIPTPLTIAGNSRVVLEKTIPYYTDTTAAVRARAYTLTQLAASQARDAALRQQAVSRLIKGAYDKDGGNAGLALEYLTSFRKDDFTEAARTDVTQLVLQLSTNRVTLMKLAGFLELHGLKDNLRPNTWKDKPQEIRWAALVSLVRMGDGFAASDMMKRVRKIAVNDDAVYQLFPDLVYSRYPEAIAYMVEAMNSDEKNCFTADAEREVAIPCGYRIMEQLAPIIDKYPLELEESGDIKTKDYVAALQKVREWFAKNKNYKILKDRY